MIRHWHGGYSTSANVGLISNFIRHVIMPVCELLKNSKGRQRNFAVWGAKGRFVLGEGAASPRVNSKGVWGAL